MSFLIKSQHTNGPEKNSNMLILVNLLDVIIQQDLMKARTVQTFLLLNEKFRECLRMQGSNEKIKYDDDDDKTTSSGCDYIKH